MTNNAEKGFWSASLAGASQGRNNNLTLVRAILASSVVLSHCWVILDQFDREPWQHYVGFQEIGSLAVSAFFFLSGFLILKSGLNWASPVDFLRARSLRIFPGLTVAVLFCIFVLGPTESSWRVHNYFTSHETWSYLWQVTLRQYDGRLPGVFANSPLFQTVDQPLWTLAYEWKMYMLVLAVCAIWHHYRGSRFDRKAWISIVLALALTMQMAPIMRYRWPIYFILGSAAFLLRRYIRLNIWIAVIGIVAGTLALRVVPVLGSILFPATLCYILLVAAFHPKLLFRPYQKVGDYSYGIYIYEWPIQQCFIPYAHGNALRLFIMAFPVTLALAVLSWHLVEAPVLQIGRQKHRGGTKGFAPEVMAGSVPPREQVI
jgi:peptidoglycan/LPS O-acetylase OafA/YrhL